MKTSKPDEEIELRNECDFRDIAENEIEACCCYEYFRESATMRETRVLPTCQDQIARSTLTFLLNKFGWQKSAGQKDVPPPWKSLNVEAKKQIARSIKACFASKSKDQKRHPPLLVRELLPGHDPVELESQFEKWKEDAYYSATAGREYFFGLFRLDETYNETKATKAFRAWFRDRHKKTRGGPGPNWRAKLNDLVVMRLWKRFPKRADAIKRVEHIVKFTLPPFKGCKDYWEERRDSIKVGRYVDRRISEAAKVEMTSARANSLKFFQALFAGETPLSYSASCKRKS
jgi:hypothetical protein